jgi:cold shock CspA family protein
MPDTRTSAPVRQHGRIIRLLRARGFGFIETADGDELFLHCSGCLPVALFDQLDEGDEVVFTVQRSPKGRRAVDVELAAATSTEEPVP